jgi:hypothetical protein
MLLRGWDGDTVDGTIAIEARDDTGEVLTSQGRRCRSV